MPKISWVKDGSIDYGYLFDISTVDELMDWWEKIKKNLAVRDFTDASTSKEVTGNPGDGHAKEGWYLALLAGIKGVDLVTALSDIQFETLSGMLKTLSKFGRIFVNRNGSYFWPHPGNQVCHTIEIESWTLPDDRIRILKWPNGKHYYAKIGNCDVVIDNQQRWFTREGAERAAEIFLNKIRMERAGK